MKESMRYLLAAGAAACGLLAAGSVRADTSLWLGSSGLFPTQIPQPWALVDTAAADPSLSAGTLRLVTAGAGEFMNYIQSPPTTSFTGAATIEARLRFVSGVSNSSNRGVAGIAVCPAQDVCNYLWINQDSIFVNTTGDVQGQSAVVDTDGAFHDYRIEVAGTTLGSAFQVYYDNGVNPVLSGTLFSQPGVGQQITWGDLTALASGTSDWQRFQHNALATPVAPTVPEPGALAGLAAVGTAAPVLLLRRRRRK